MFWIGMIVGCRGYLNGGITPGYFDSVKLNYNR